MRCMLCQLPSMFIFIIKFLPLSFKFTFWCQVYVGEIADKEIRGKLGSFFQLLITVGIMLVYVLGAYNSAQITSSVCGFIPVLFAICIFFCPESPTFYVSI